jgi:hypothetical protein
MILYPTFEERYRYLRMGGRIGEETFGFDRMFNQSFYKSREWKEARRKAIIRDNGCDLAIPDRVIFDKVIVHHINPLTLEQIEEGGPELFDLRNLVCVSLDTHNAIHYGDESLLIKTNFVERKPNDTCPWL